MAIYTEEPRKLWRWMGLVNGTFSAYSKFFIERLLILKVRCISFPQRICAVVSQQFPHGPCKFCFVHRSSFTDFSPSSSYGSRAFQNLWAISRSAIGTLDGISFPFSVRYTTPVACGCELSPENFASQILVLILGHWFSATDSYVACRLDTSAGYSSGFRTGAK